MILTIYSRYFTPTQVREIYFSDYQCLIMKWSWIWQRNNGIIYSGNKQYLTDESNVSVEVFRHHDVTAPPPPPYDPEVSLVRTQVQRSNTIYYTRKKHCRLLSCNILMLVVHFLNVCLFTRSTQVSHFLTELRFTDFTFKICGPMT